METRIDKYRRHLEKTKSPNTVVAYCRAVKLWLRFAIRRGVIGNSVLQDFALNLSDRYKPRSVHVIIAAVWHYLDWLRGQGEKIPPLRRPEQPKKGHLERHYLTVAELHAALESLKNWSEPSRTALVLLAASGLRVSELCNLKISDITVHANGTLVLHVLGKGDKLRDVPTLSFATPYVSNYIKTWWKTNDRSGSWLFPSRNYRYRKQISTRVVDHWCQRLSKEIGKRVFPHAFRHTYITLMQEAGVEDMILATIVGHSSVTTTMGYAHPSSETLAKQAKLTGDYFNGKKKGN